MEITTPLINNRYFLAKADMKSSALYLVNGLAICALWFIFRICLFGYFGIVMIKALPGLVRDIEAYVVVSLVSGYTVGYGLQLAWGYKIFRGAYKLIAKKKGS